MSTIGIVDTPGHTLQVKAPRKRHRTNQERRQIVEETFLPSASVSRVARKHDVNANQLFRWRKLYREGRLGGGVGAAALLPVKLSEEAEKATQIEGPVSRWGTLEVKVSKGTIRIVGAIDPLTLRTVLECLAL